MIDVVSITITVKDNKPYFILAGVMMLYLVWQNK